VINIQLFTDGGKFYPDRKIPFYYNPIEEFLTETEYMERLRIIHIKSGTGIIKINHHRIVLIAPTLLCINEKDLIYLEQDANIRAVSLYFHPGFINVDLNFDNIRGKDNDISLTTRQDSHLFKPFVARSPEYYGELNIDSIASLRIAELFGVINNEAIQQIDWYWTCRARSYFLELLFFIERIFFAPDAMQGLKLSNTTSSAEKIILYLHAHYNNKITIDELCKCFNTNRTTLQKQFQILTGLPVMTYLMKLRIRLATLMLKDTGILISEIVERLGFNDNAHFDKVFRKQTGYSPTEYRQLFTWLK
jgi:AraC family L-rhamnose operon regulatory protein RhaS